MLESMGQVLEHGWNVKDYTGIPVYRATSGEKNEGNFKISISVLMSFLPNIVRRSL